MPQCMMAFYLLCCDSFLGTDHDIFKAVSFVTWLKKKEKEKRKKEKKKKKEKRKKEKRKKEEKKKKEGCYL